VRKTHVWLAAQRADLATTPMSTLENWVNDEFVAFEIDENGCGQLKSELPLDLTEAEVGYIKSLLPRAEAGLLQLLDPNTGEVVFACTPVLTL
jgi:hypothetical protein